MNSMRNILVVQIIGLVLVGCAASGPKYTEMQSTIPPLNHAMGWIFFYRDASAFGAAMRAPIYLNGELVGKSEPGGFFYVDRPPGNYEASCSTEVERHVTFTLDSGENAYVETTVSFGVLVGRINPTLVDPAHGNKEIQNLSYIGDQMPAYIKEYTVKQGQE